MSTEDKKAAAPPKFTFKPDPTFVAPVDIPLPGKSPERIVCTFRHKTGTEINAFVATRPDDRKYLAEILVAWDLDDELNEANIDRLVDLFPSAAPAIANKYLTELREGRRGN